MLASVGEFIEAFIGKGSKGTLKITDHNPVWSELEKANPNILKIFCIFLNLFLNVQIKNNLENIIWKAWKGCKLCKYHVNSMVISC